MVNFESILGILKEAGFFDFVLPWLLFFAIFLGLLDKAGFISKERNINSIIAAVIAFFIIAYTPVGGTAAFYINTFGAGAMIISALFVLVIFISILGFTPKNLIGGEGGPKKEWQRTLVLIILLILAYAVYTNAIGSPLSLNVSFGLSEETWTMLLVLLFIVLIVWFVSKGGVSEEEKRKYKEEGVKEAIAAQQAKK